MGWLAVLKLLGGLGKMMQSPAPPISGGGAQAGGHQAQGGLDLSGLLNAFQKRKQDPQADALAKLAQMLQGQGFGGMSMASGGVGVVPSGGSQPIMTLG